MPMSWPRCAPTTDSQSLERLQQDEVRLRVVRESGLLDSPAEPSFDALTALAARLIKVPASFISIVDSGRDFYKSQSGFAAPLSQDREIAGRTFCHYTLASDEALVIDDTHSNPVWRAVPTVESMGVRAYVGVPLRVGGKNIGSFCVIDIEPRVWLDDELETIRQLALSAARELTLRAALETAEALVSSANALARAREEVVAVVAHDLRTPLQVLYLSTAMLQRGTQGQQDALTGRMMSAIEAMKTMADNLLTANTLLAPSSAGRQVVRATDLARDAVDMMGPIAERSGITLALGERSEASVLVDYPQMLRVLGNLIGNALKYSPEGSAITVSAREADGMLCLVVADNGKGMNDIEQSQAFNRGWQGDEGMKRGDGAGLGLSIVKSLVEAHEGKVGIEGAPGKGTVVTVCLPLQKPSDCKPGTGLAAP